MKKLPNGALAFYPVWWRGALVMCFFLLIAFVFSSSMQDAAGMMLMGFVGVMCLGVGIKQIFFSSPACVLYPEKVRVGKKELFWDQVANCDVRDEWWGRARVRVLVFLPHPVPGVGPLKVQFSQFSSRDKKLLKKEISLRGVSFL